MKFKFKFGLTSHLKESVRKWTGATTKRQ